jgi:hypothetical protein
VFGSSIFCNLLACSADKKFVKVNVPAYNSEEIDAVLNYYRAAGWLTKGRFSSRFECFLQLIVKQACTAAPLFDHLVFLVHESHLVSLSLPFFILDIA